MSKSGTDVGLGYSIARDEHWPLAEKLAIMLNPKCAGGGPPSGLQAHHKRPYHFCEIGLKQVNYHLLDGHADDFESSNPYAEEDAARMFGWTEEQIKADPVWQQHVQERYPALKNWTDQHKADFRAELDRDFPLPDGVTPEQQKALLIGKLKSLHAEMTEKKGETA
jgi:hypothetical protein